MKKHKDDLSVILNDEIDSSLKVALKYVINEWYFLEDMKEIVCNYDNDNYKRQVIFEYFYRYLKDYLFINEDFLKDLIEESKGETY